MYSDKENVNMLTALLVAHGVHHAVVCPGSRNAPIVHNLNECPDVHCWPVTDERSAAFFALGIIQATEQPVAVCVTSGSALLNTLPAVAEAYYQQLPLIVVSADRPAAWIDQTDGQTLQQPRALEPWVAKSVSLPEPTTDTERWHCNRLLNEALIEVTDEAHRPVHINVPISEPLFSFTTPQLPRERVIHRYAPLADYDCLCSELVDDFLNAERPLVVFGQMAPGSFSPGVADHLFSHVMALHEALADFPSVCHVDEVLAKPLADATPLLPDFVLYVGGGLVSKHLKRFLRQAHDARVWRVSLTGQVEDTFQNLRGIIVGDAEFVIQSLSNKLARRHAEGTVAALAARTAYRRRWLALLKQADSHAGSYQPPYSQMAAVRGFEARLASAAYSCRVHYANSSAIRLANIYARHHVFCNRGVNGIEGSLSTAAGYAAAQPSVTFCVIGDLSFFYDQNALWTHPSLRILLLNNGKGGIFDRLPGLSGSPAHPQLVAGSHATTAQGVCQQYGVDYRSAGDTAQLEEGLDWLTSEAIGKPPLEGICNPRPMLLEVFTTSEADKQALDDYINTLQI